MIYFSYNPNEDNYNFLFKSDVSTQELDRFFTQNANINIIPSVNEWNRRKNRTTDEKFGIYRKICERITDDKINKLEADFKGQVKYIEYDEWCKVAIATQKKFEQNYNPSNEADIREKTDVLINELHNIKFLEYEYTHHSLPVRADILAVSNNKEVITVEIKSDKDTFVRLEKQLKEYVKFSHITYVALDISHLPKYLKKFNSSIFHTIGIIVYENNEVYLYNEPYKSKSIDATSLLWKNEYLSFLTPFSINTKCLSVHEAIMIIQKVFTVYEFQMLCEQLFINRYINDKNFRLDAFLEDKEYKNAKILKVFSEVMGRKIKDKGLFKE
jgi:Holliday junction resolvase